MLYIRANEQTQYVDYWYAFNSTYINQQQKKHTYIVQKIK